MPRAVAILLKCNLGPVPFLTIWNLPHWERRQESNLLSLGYEPSGLPFALSAMVAQDPLPP